MTRDATQLALTIMLVVDASASENFGMATDVLEVHHLDGNHRNNRYSNWILLHAHCHDQVHGTRSL